jgi:hypothetical protein
MVRQLVTLGTDGTRDWVKTPDGRTYLTGHISMAKLVGSLAGSTREAKIALDEWLAGHETMLSVDSDRMAELFQPARPKWAHGSLIGALLVGTEMDDTKIASLTQAVLGAQEALRDLSVKAASLVEPTPEEQAVRLATLQVAFNQTVAKVAQELPEGQEEAKAASQEAPEEVQEDQQAKTAALRFQLHKALVKLSMTDAMIGELTQERKRFNHLKAKTDVGRLVSRIASITSSNQDLTGESVGELVASTDRLYGLFFPEG